MTLNEALLRWRGANTHWSDSAQEAAARLSAVWKEVFGSDTLVAGVRPVHVEELARVRDDGTRAGATLKHERGYLRAFFKWARAHGLTAIDPTVTWQVKVSPPPAEYYRVLLPDEERELLAVAPAWLGRFVVVAVGTGLREGTIRQMRWEWIVEKEGAAWVNVPAEAMKKGRPHRMPLRAEVRAALGERGTGLVFDLPAGPRLWYELQKAARKAGIAPGLKVHDLRRTFASRLLDRGVPIETVMRLGAWSSSSTMFQHYIAQMDDQRALEALTQ